MTKRTSMQTGRTARAKSGPKARAGKRDVKSKGLAVASAKGVAGVSTQLSAIADDSLRKICRRILTKLEAREGKEKKGKSLSPEASAKGYLLRAVYRHVLEFLEDDKMAVVNDAVIAVARCRTAPANPFASFLMLILALKGDVTKSTKNWVRQQAIALDYAHQCDVPREYLIGFIYQVGGVKRIVHKPRRDKKQR